MDTNSQSQDQPESGDILKIELKFYDNDKEGDKQCLELHVISNRRHLSSKELRKVLLQLLPFIVSPDDALDALTAISFAILQSKVENGEGEVEEILSRLPIFEYLRNKKAEE